jgi:hypothetical protein
LTVNIPNTDLANRIEKAKDSKDLAYIIKTIGFAQMALELTKTHEQKSKKRGDKELLDLFNNEILNKHYGEAINFGDRIKYLEESIKLLEKEKKYLENIKA